MSIWLVCNNKPWETFDSVKLEAVVINYTLKSKHSSTVII